MQVTHTKTEKIVGALLKKTAQKAEVHFLFVVSKKQNTKPKKKYREKRERR